MCVGALRGQKWGSSPITVLVNSLMWALTPKLGGPVRTASAFKCPLMWILSAAVLRRRVGTIDCGGAGASGSQRSPCSADSSEQSAVH